MDKYIKERVFLEDIPGLCVSIRKGSDIFRNAYGFSDFEEKIPMNCDNVFHCTSISKLVTAKAAGSFDMDSSVCDILPWLDMDSRITLRMLLTHTSGIGDTSDYGWENAREDENALKEYLMGYRIPVLAQPGERFIYSNIGYDILGAAVSELSGMSFEDYADISVLRKAGLLSATFNTAAREDKELLAKPHVKDERKRIIKSGIYPYTREHAPSSCLTAPIDDIGRLADYAMKTLSDEEVKPYALVPDTGEHMGLGWFIREQEGRTLYGHEGADMGFRSSLWICPEEDIHIVLLANISGAPLKKMSKAIFNMLTKNT